MRGAFALWLGLPALAMAQGARVEAGGASAALRVRSTIGASREALSGTALGMEGRADLWGVILEVGYLQGRVKPDSGSPLPRDVVEGRLLVGNRPWRGLTFKAGPHIRSYLTTSGTQRWFFWEARVRGERPIVASVRGYAEIWRVLSGDVNVVEGFDGGQGGEAGMLVRLPGSAVWGRLAYGIERSKLGGGTRIETVEGLSLAVGYGLGRSPASASARPSPQTP